MCGVVWCKSRQNIAKSNTFLLFLRPDTKKSIKPIKKDIMKTTEVFATHYITPLIEIIHLEMEGGVLAGSTGESFEDDGIYEGTWS